MNTEKLAKYVEDNLKDLENRETNYSKLARIIVKTDPEFSGASPHWIRRIIGEIYKDLKGGQPVNKATESKPLEVKTETGEVFQVNASEYRKAILENDRLKRDLKEKENQLKIYKSEYEFDEILKRFLSQITPQRIINNIPEFQRYNREEVSYIQFLSDVHYGEVVSKAHTYTNEYNCEIAKCRLWKYMKACYLEIQKEKEHSNINEHNIVLGGDMVTGNIHEELRNSNEIIVTEAAKDLSMILTLFIETYLKIVPKLRIFAIYGNHGRFGEKVYYKNSHENFDYILYQYLQIRLDKYIQNGHIEFIAPKGKDIVAEIQGNKFLFSHGDEITSIKQQRYINEKIEFQKETHGDFKYWLIGHFHKFSLFNNLIINGSVIGNNEYSKKKYKPEAAKQLLLRVNREYCIQNYFDIQLQDAKEHHFDIEIADNAGVNENNIIL